MSCMKPICSEMEDTQIWSENQEGIQIIFDMDGGLHVWIGKMNTGGRMQILMDDSYKT